MVIPETERLTTEGLRERKKRLTRQLISDTATAMFLESGFDEVKVADIAAACDVSEKTVYNYFPTKESLLLDREAEVARRLREALGPDGPPSTVDAVVAWVSDDIRSLFSSGDLATIRRFGELIDTTASLQAAWQRMTDRLTDIATEAIAVRSGVDPGDPEPRIAAVAILGLGSVRMRATHRYTDGNYTAEEARDLVIDEVRRAARLLEVGLRSFDEVVHGAGSKRQPKTAARPAKKPRGRARSSQRQARRAPGGPGR